ncbi:hypothetical protein ACWCQX_47010, partial [Streptomyces sp. NPDC002346]
MTDSAKPRYEHVLLVEPRAMPGESYDFGPVDVHAGGIAWHRNRLCVADTKGGLRVFNTDQMFRVSTGGPARSWCGYNAGTRKYYAYGYRYALPQSRAYDNAGARLVYSQAAIDHSAGPPTLLVSEFQAVGYLVGGAMAPKSRDRCDHDRRGSGPGAIFLAEDPGCGELA